MVYASLNEDHVTAADQFSVTPPHSLEAEQGVLGVLLYDNNAYDGLLVRLQAGHFFDPFHQRLFQAIESRIRRGDLAEPAVLADQFREDAGFVELGGLRYLADLVDRAPSAAAITDPAQVIFDLAVRRNLIRISGEIAVAARGGGRNDGSLSGLDQVERAEQMLYDLLDDCQEPAGFTPLGDALRGAIEYAAEAFVAEGDGGRLSTGLLDLDTRTGGLADQDQGPAAHQIEQETGGPSRPHIGVAVVRAGHHQRRWIQAAIRVGQPSVQVDDAAEVAAAGRWQGLSGKAHGSCAALAFDFLEGAFEQCVEVGGHQGRTTEQISRQAQQRMMAREVRVGLLEQIVHRASHRLRS